MMSAPLHPPPPEEQQRRRRNPRREVQPTTTTIPSKDSEETIALRILKSDGAAIYNRILKTGLNWKHIGNDSFQKEEYILCHKDCKKDTYEEGETGFKGFEGIAKCHNINPLQFHSKFPLPPPEKEKGTKCPVCADFQYDIILDSLSNYPDKTTKDDWDALLPKIAEIEAKHKKEEAEKKKTKEEEREKKKEELRKKRKKKEKKLSSKKRLKQATTNNDGGNDQTVSEVSIVVVDDDDDEEEEVAVIGGSGNGGDGLLAVETNPRFDEEESKPPAAASTSRPSGEMGTSSSFLSPRSVVDIPFDNTSNGTSSSTALSKYGGSAGATSAAASDEDTAVGSSSIIGSNNNNNNAVTRNNESTTPSLAVGSSTEPQPLQQSHPQQRQQVDVAAIQLQLQQAKQEIQRLNDENKSLKDAASAAVQQQQQQQQNTDANEKSLKDEIESLRNENTALKDSAVKNEELIEASKKEKQTLNFKIDNLQKIIDAQIDLLKLKE